MKLSLLLNVVDPGIGGVLVMGHRGTAKSTAVRSLAHLLPEVDVVRGCPYQSDPRDPCGLCPACRETQELVAETRPLWVVDLPLGSTVDRVAGTLDLEKALLEGKKSFEPGLLARAHRGFLYIDEVNLLEDHLVDLLLDVAAAGVNLVERESISVRHPARFVLIGSGNPEEGELRPQLLDRFGLSVRIETEQSPDLRLEVVKRRLRFDRDPEAFAAEYSKSISELRSKIRNAGEKLASVTLPDPILRRVAELCAELGIDGHRGELTVVRAARALAALSGSVEVSLADVRAVTPLSLGHRLRRDPLESSDSGHRIDRAVAAHLKD